eukprot:GHUV01056182.1.p1 GENE.GHUV01056182.1~~GHUV01056182.1.p1  ORF type:complete len:132 (-),score=27.71 GHUV01056182.1:7-402(-)
MKGASLSRSISNRLPVDPALASGAAGAGDVGAAGAAAGVLLFLLTQLRPPPKQMSRKIIRMTMMTATPITIFILKLFHHILCRKARPLFTKRSACTQPKHLVYPDVHLTVTYACRRSTVKKCRQCATASCS